MTFIALRIAMDVSGVRRIKHECHNSWQARYLVMLECQFLWRAHHLVKFWDIAGARKVFTNKMCLQSSQRPNADAPRTPREHRRLTPSPDSLTAAPAMQKEYVHQQSNNDVDTRVCPSSSLTLLCDTRV